MPSDSTAHTSPTALRALSALLAAPAAELRPHMPHTCTWPTEGEATTWICNTTEEDTMGHPYRERHTQPDSTTSDKLAGAQAKQTEKKTTPTAKQKRSSK